MDNTVELIGYYGSDEIIACSAWTSTSRELTEEKKKRIPELIEQLWRNGHETPFEKGIVHFLVNCDIASHIHLLKHRITSLNAESARYKELKEDKFYVPEEFFEVYPEPRREYGWRSYAHILEDMTWQTNKLYHKCLEDVERKFGRKRAKESARYFKMYNSQIQSDISFNLRSFANFLNLRMSEFAQGEIREIAESMLNLVRQTGKFEHTLKAWGYGKTIDNGDME